MKVLPCTGFALHKSSAVHISDGGDESLTDVGNVAMCGDLVNIILYLKVIIKNHTLKVGCAIGIITPRANPSGETSRAPGRSPSHLAGQMVILVIISHELLVNEAHG